MQQDEVIIRKGIVHILDGELGYPVYSEEELELTPDINDFFRAHIYKLLSGDELKKCHFSEEEPSEVYELVQNFSEETGSGNSIKGLQRTGLQNNYRKRVQ